MDIYECVLSSLYNKTLKNFLMQTFFSKNQGFSGHDIDAVFVSASETNKAAGRHLHLHSVGKKCATLLLSISFPIIDQFSKFFHWHTLQTTCDNVIIIDLVKASLHYFVKYQ